MQSTTTNGITISYPDTPCMIFNPVPIFVSGTMAKTTVYISDSGGNTTLTVTYQTPNGGAVDVREYVQGLFDGLTMGADIDYTQQTKVSELGQSINFTVNCYDSTDTQLASFHFTLFCIWGALKTGEVFDQYRTVTWFMNYPFTVGYYVPAAATIAVGINSSPQTVESLASEGLYNILIDDAMGGQYMTIYNIIGTLAQATFDNTFDLTFYYTLNGTQEEKIRIRLVDDVDEGMYLRWVNRQGMWCYWLFKEGSPNRTIASDGIWNRNDYSKWIETYHWQQDAGRRQNYTRNDVIPVCAPLVDSDTFDYLQDITSSPVVDMYMGKDANNTPMWTPVTIEAGTYTKDFKKVEQDFIMNVVLPEIPIQKL